MLDIRENKEVNKLIQFSYYLHKDDFKSSSLTKIPLIEFDDETYCGIKKVDDNNYICGLKGYYTHGDDQTYINLGIIKGNWINEKFNVERAVLYKVSEGISNVIYSDLGVNTTYRKRAILNRINIKSFRYSSSYDKEEQIELFLLDMEIIGYKRSCVIELLKGEKTAEELYVEVAPDHLKDVRWVDFGRRTFKFEKNVAVEGNFSGIPLKDFPFPFEGDVVFECEKVNVNFADFDSLKRKVSFINKANDKFSNNLYLGNSYVENYFDKPLVLANADNKNMAIKAINEGACGIGLVRSEYMLNEEIILSFIEMITKGKINNNVLDKFTNIQKEQTKEIISICHDKKCVFRLLDFKLYEFMKIYTTEKVNIGIADMRGAKLLNFYPEILKAQLNGIFSAFDSTDKDIELLVPLIMNDFEFKDIKETINEVANAYNLGNVRVGAMIETYQAVKIAGSLANSADFICFGTGDLTESIEGVERDDSDWKWYYQNLSSDVKDNIKDAIYRIRSVKEDMPIGFCGVHTDYLENLNFYSEVGASYISCGSVYLNCLTKELEKIDFNKKQEKYKEFSHVLKKVISTKTNL